MREFLQNRMSTKRDIELMASLASTRMKEAIRMPLMSIIGITEFVKIILKLYHRVKKIINLLINI